MEGGDVSAVTSVRAAAQELRNELRASGSPLALPHIRAIVDLATSRETHPNVRDIVARIREQRGASVESPPSWVPVVPTDRGTSPEGSTCLVTDHWLLSVPAALWTREEDVVNYLGMVVAIDFRHWGEEGEEGGGGQGSRDPAAAAGTASDVPRVVDFYAPAPRVPLSCSGAQAVVGAPAGGAERARDAGAPSALLRGSAAMVHLLKAAVEEHGIAWYDPSFLARFAGDRAAAAQALSVCFRGCRSDGVTPMQMPAAAERVELLLSVGAALQAAGASFYSLLANSGGRLFREDGRGFLQALVHLHPRYRDWAPHPLHPSRLFPILKLAQLTAVSLQCALPALWATQRGGGVADRFGPSPGECRGPLAWLHAGDVGGSPDAPVRLFTDADQLSICCDYQIPRALRNVGVLVYGDDLAAAVDGGVVLRVGGSLEVSLRVATLVAVESVLDYLATIGLDDVTAPELDYTLWYIGRHPPSGGTASRHHLCRTIMY